MRYIQSNLIFYGFTISFHHSKEVFVCCLIVSLRCVFWVGLSIRGGGIDLPRPASQRAAAFILTAAMLTTFTAPAFAKTWDIADGDITVKAGEAEGPNKVKQGDSDFVKDEGDTIITGTSNQNTVTIEAENKGDKVEVTLKDVNIKATGGKAAVSVTGKGDTTIELDGDNKLSGSGAHAALEHNQTVDSEKNVTSGKLTIQDDNDKAGSLTATGGIQNGAGIGAGGSGVSSGKIEITGGDIAAVGGKSAAGIGGSGYRGNADITISGGTIRATGGDQAAGIGGGTSGNGKVTITGDAVIEESIGGSSGAGAGNVTGGAGIGGGANGHGTIDISGNAQVKNALGKDGGAGIGSGYEGDGNVNISGNATIENAEGGKFAAGIGGGYHGNGNVTISGNAKIDNVSGGKQAAGIGGGSFGDGTIIIKDNAAIGTVIGGAYGAGIGGGAYSAGIGGGARGVGDVTIEGNVTIKNARGGSNAAGIGGGYGAENDEDGNGNQITIKSNESGAPTVNATGGVSEVDIHTGETIPGGAGIGSGLGDAKADITLEGKVTIVAKGGEGNAAIGANGIEQEFSGLAEGSSITRSDSEGNDITLPTDPGYPVPADTSSSGGGSATSSAPASPLPGLTVTDKDGQRISYTSTQSGNTLTVCVGRFTASLRASLSTLRQLRAEGIDTITFQTILCSTTLSVDELLTMGGEDAEIVLTHHIRSSTLTVGGKAV